MRWVWDGSPAQFLATRSTGTGSMSSPWRIRAAKLKSHQEDKVCLSFAASSLFTKDFGARWFPATSLVLGDPHLAHYLFSDFSQGSKNGEPGWSLRLPPLPPTKKHRSVAAVSARARSRFGSQFRQVDISAGPKSRGLACLKAVGPRKKHQVKRPLNTHRTIAGGNRYVLVCVFPPPPPLLHLGERFEQGTKQRRQERLSCRKLAAGLGFIQSV